MSAGYSTETPVRGHQAVETSQRRTLSLSTPVSVALILGCASFVVGAIWWAATLQAKLDQVLEEVKAVRGLEARVIDMEARVRQLEKKP